MSPATEKLPGMTRVTKKPASRRCSQRVAGALRRGCRGRPGAAARRAGAPAPAVTASAPVRRTIQLLSDPLRAGPLTTPAGGGYRRPAGTVKARGYSA